MIRWSRILIVALLVAAAASPATAQDRLARRVSLDLKAMAPPDAFKVLADAVGLTAKVDPAVTAPVDILVRDVRARTALDTMCDSIGCDWSVSGRLIVVRPAGEPDQRVRRRVERTREVRTDERVTARIDRRATAERIEELKAALKKTLPEDMKFVDVPLETVSQKLSEALGIHLSIMSDDPAVRTVTIDLSSQTLLLGLKKLTGPGDRHAAWTLKLGVEDSGGPKGPAMVLKLSTRSKVTQNR